jgi:hypothetical protein
VNDKLDPGLRPDVVRALEDAYQAEQFGEVAAIEFESVRPNRRRPRRALA